MGYSGPLPPASELIKYEEAHPGAADRIIGLAEDTLRMRNNVYDQQIGLSRRRVNASVIMSLGMLSIAGLAIVYDPAWLSIPLGALGILTLMIRELIRVVRKLVQRQSEKTPSST